jgi:predicted nucleic acid-binding protein
MQKEFPYQVIVDGEKTLVWADSRDQALIKAARLYQTAQTIQCERVDSSGRVIPAIIACASNDGVVQHFSSNVLEDLPGALLCLAYEEDSDGCEEEMILFRQKDNNSQYVHAGEYSLLDAEGSLDELLIDCRSEFRTYLEAM